MAHRFFESTRPLTCRPSDSCWPLLSCELRSRDSTFNAIGPSSTSYRKRLSVHIVPEASTWQTRVLKSSESFFHWGVMALMLTPLSCAQFTNALRTCSWASDGLLGSELVCFLAQLSRIACSRLSRAEPSA